jgi:hypothetical protein
LFKIVLAVTAACPGEEDPVAVGNYLAVDGGWYEFLAVAFAFYRESCQRPRNDEWSAPSNAEYETQNDVADEVVDLPAKP